MKNPHAALFTLCALLTTGCKKIHDPTVWKLESLEAVGGIPVEVLGAPVVENREGRKSLCFDGADDGLLLPANPLQGLRTFTIEVLFYPEGDGPAEQRFLHIEDEASRRVLIETRLIGQRTWALDTFLRATDTDKLTLLDRDVVQPTDRWFWAALVYDGATMAHFVDGHKQLAGAVAFSPMAGGRMSLGVRQNKVHWFKGCIAEVRFSAKALGAQALQRAN